MRQLVLAAALMGLSLPALAEGLPQFPKAGPPSPLPEPSCDVSLANNGGWLLGQWVAPHTKWSFSREGEAITWTLDRKGSVNEGFGWRDGATITGTVTQASGCTVQLKAGEGAFQFDGVLTEEGKLFGYALNQKGDTVRFVLRRAR